MQQSNNPFALAALAALTYRNRTGKGQYIDLSQTEAMIPLTGEAIMEYTMNGRVPNPQGNRDNSMVPHSCYRCKGNDKWITISVSSDKEWASLCRVLGNPKWSNDDRFDTTLKRWHHQDEINKLIAVWTIDHNQYDAMKILQTAGVPAGAVLGVPEVCEEPHLKERGFFVNITHREAGTNKYPGMFFRYSGTPAPVRIPPNCLGEHNDYVYGKLLGMTKEEIALLEEEDIIGDTYLPEVL